MNLIDLNALTEFDLSANAARTANVNGTGVDIFSYEGVLKVTQNVGTVSGTTPTLVGKLQASADNAAWTDIAGATFAQATAAGKQSIALDTRKVGETVPGAKFIRYVGTIGGTTPSFTIAVYATGATKRLG